MEMRLFVLVSSYNLPPMKKPTQFRAITSLGVLFLLAQQLHAQFLFDFQTNPDSAAVYMNNALQGKTPLRVAIRWEDVPKDGLVFRVEKRGFEPEEWVVDGKPRNIRVVKKFILERSRPKFVCDSMGAWVGFDKLAVQFPSGTVIGKHSLGGRTEDLTWEGFSRAGSEEFAPKAYDVLGNAGFLTPQLAANQLFSSEKRSRKSPRFIIGGKVIDLWLEMNQVYTTVRGNNRIKIEWQVLDRSTNSVVYKTESSAEVVDSYVHPVELRPLEDLFGVALENFLTDGKLFELVKAAGTSSTIFSEETPIADSTQTVLQLKPVPIDRFESTPEMIQFATQACVTISTDQGHGSGAFISEDGLVLTAAHVVSGVNRVSVILSNGVELQAKVQAIDEKWDVALLKVAGSKFKALPLSKGLSVGVGEEVLTIGTPSDIELGQSVSKGILSGKRKQEDIIYLQTDVSVSPGNSGGPLLTKEGRIIGVIQRKLIGNGIEGVGFALPVETAAKRLGLIMAE